MSRPKLFFIVKYIAPLKYYAKLIPSLINTYDIKFVLLADRGMVKYCREKKYQTYELFIEPPKKPKIRIPFISAIFKQQKFLRDCDFFLNKEKPAKLIAVVSKNFHIQALFAKAKRLGVETIGLQWAMQYERLDNPELPIIARIKKAIQKIYFKILDPALNLFYKNQSKYDSNLTEYQANKIGLIGDYDKNNFIALGYDPKKMKIVGSADFDAVQKLKKTIDSDINLKKILADKYGLNKDKENILIFSTIFYKGKTIRFTDEAGQIKYFLDIIKLVREVYSKEQADILFKFHPKEQNIYKPLEEIGVKVYGSEAMSEELISLSNLCISHPETSVNFMIMAAAVPAIFINLSPIISIDRGKKYYNLKNLIKDQKEFVSCLKEFKAKKLPLQYDPGHFNPNSIESITRFINEPL